jgi:XTP/dITP diphosphohydrolase
MKILLATSNKNKLKEIKDILKSTKLNIVGLDDVGGEIEVKEEAGTFGQNAVIKAKVYCDHYKMCTIADDSGLVIKALNGEPGVMSSRYAPTDEERINKVLEKMKTVPDEYRGAYFECAMALAIPDGRYIVRRGFCFGKIIYEPRGENGFGYDPIFQLKGSNKTLAELTMAEKNKVSHRFQALKQIYGDIKKVFDKGEQSDNFTT